MTPVTVRFDRVFDIVHGRHRRKEVTFFGFESAGTKRYGVPAPGKLDIRSPALVTAILRKPNNWQTLAGWFNHTTGEVVVESSDYENFSVVWCCIALFFVWPLYGAYPVWAALAFLGIVAWASWAVASMRTLRRIRSRLEAMRDDAATAAENLIAPATSDPSGKR